jgi:hypothetical protein
MMQKLISSFDLALLIDSLGFILLYGLTGLIMSGRAYRVAKGELPLHAYISIATYWPLFMLIQGIIHRRNQ